MNAFRESPSWQVLPILLFPAHSYVTGDISFIGLDSYFLQTQTGTVLNTPPCLLVLVSEKAAARCGIN